MARFLPAVNGDSEANLIKIPLRDPKYALNAFWISDADLNMRLFAKSSVSVNSCSLQEDASDGIVGFEALVRLYPMEMIDNGTI
jgi:hypothetical protein